MSIKAQLVSSAIVASSMSLVMSTTMVWINLGPNPMFWGAVGKSCLTGILVGWPASLLLVPLAQKVANKLDSKNRVDD